MSVVKRNPNLGPSQMCQRRRKLFWVRFYIILFFLLVIVLGLAIFSGHDRVRVKTIIVSGNAAVSADAILAIANRDMAGRYGYLFAKDNYLIFPRFQIKEDILKEIKTVKEVNISWDHWQQISINILERKPHSVWCGESMTVPDQVCFFVDNEGYIYTEAPVFSGTMFVKNYGLFLSKSIYSEIYNLIDILYRNNLKVVAVAYDGFDYKFVLEIGPEIIFNNKNGFALSFSNLFTALETKDLDLIKDASIIDYIDLRYDNKVVVGKK